MQAIFEAKIAAVELLRHLSFELKTGQQITYSDKITMSIRSGDKDELLVWVKNRKPGMPS